METGLVKGALAEAVVTRTGEYAQGRLPVAGDTRILVHDPFELLIHLTKKAKMRELLKQAKAQISPDEAKARELPKKAKTLLKQAARLMPRDGEKARELLEEAAALISPDENNLPVSREGYVYAPGIDANRLLLLRSPHVSAFEDVVADTLRIGENAEKPVRKQYQDYFGAHTGCVFVNSYVAAGLGGADFDGDRVKCVWDKDCVALAQKNAREIVRLLQKSTDESFGQLPQEVKQLPIVKINGPAAQKCTAADVNRDFWGKTFQTYERALSSQVGRLSILAAGVAFSPEGDQTGPGPAEEAPGYAIVKLKVRGSAAKAKVSAIEFREQVSPAEEAPAQNPGRQTDPLTPEEIARLRKLRELSLLTCVVGNDIDSAKTGVKPEIPTLQTKVSAGGGQTLNFAKAMKKNDDLTGLRLYRKAMQAAGKISKNVPAANLPEAFQLKPEEMETLENWTGKNRQKAELYPLLVTQAEETALEQIPKQTRKEAAEAIRKERDERSAAGKRQKALENLQTQRRNLLEALLENYPLYQAEGYFRAMTQAEYTGEKIPLYSDQKAIQYAFMTCKEREGVFAPVLFGDGKKGGEGFEYDETVLALTKHLQRYRGAIKDRNDNAPDPNREAGKKDKIEDLLEKKRDQGVNLWLMGLALLKHRQVTEREFVQKFARYLPAAQEEKNQEGGAAHAEPQA